MTCLRITVLLGLVLIACSSDDDEDPKHGNGVNDVRQACEIRRTWNRDAPDCSTCEAATITPRCDCSSLQAFSAVCSEQAATRDSSCSEAIRNCAYACTRDDCDCLDKCYADDANCKAASAARDGCTADVCTQYCK